MNMKNKPNLNIDDVFEETAEEKVETSDKVSEQVEEVKEEKINIKSTPKKVEEDYICNARCGEIVKVKNWKEIFTANYEGTSEEAKALKPFLKETYKGDVYIPWAVMERLTYMCDEYAKFTNICNQNGGLVHTDMVINHQKNIQKGEVISETEAPMYSHFVKVALEFMGKVFIEDYPIQDQDYTAARVFNQNLVNRAIQRARAKVAARATGLALRLYEGFDLQFEETIEPKKPELLKEEIKPNVKETTKSVEKVVEKTKKEVENNKNIVKNEVVMPYEQKVQNVVDIETKPFLEGETELTTKDVKCETLKNVNHDIKDLVDIIKNSDENKMTTVLQRVNVSIMKKYSFALSTKDTEEELTNKLSQFPNVAQFKKTIINLLG